MKTIPKIVPYLTLLVTSLSFFIPLAFADPKGCFNEEVTKLYSDQQSSIEDLYRHFHQNPELSFYEEETGKKLAEEFRSAGLTVTENVGGFGVVGVLKNGAGPTILLRTDMDALPVLEETGAPFASKAISNEETGSVPVMHACGHDIHLASIPSTVRILSKLKDQWSGTLVAIGQPAEERGAGARAMLKDGLFTRFPKPDYLLAHHINPFIEVGKLSIQPGYFTANVDSVDITVKGRGGHGAYPHKTKDPVLLASQIVVALQSIVSREVKPIEAAVVTVGSIHGGTKHNVIPDEVKLQLTIRSYTDEVRTQVLDAIKRIAKGVAITAGLPEKLYPEVTLAKEEYTPAGYNSLELSEMASNLWKEVFSEEVLVPGEKVMGGEDFAVYGKQKVRIPSLMFRIGSVSKADIEKSKMEGADPLPSLHSSRFLPRYKQAIKTGSIAMSTLALKLFGACEEKTL